MEDDGEGVEEEEDADEGDVHVFSAKTKENGFPTRATGGTWALKGKLTAGVLEASLTRQAQAAAWLAHVAAGRMMPPWHTGGRR